MDRADMEFFENLFRSLEGEMRQGFAEVNRRFTEVNTRLTQMSDRLDRVGGLVNGGARAIARLAEWSERTDITTADLLHRVADMDQRLRKLEGKKD
jgi:hypothetical protein